MDEDFDPKRLILIHGLMGSSQGFKAKMLRKIFPEMLIPDFKGALDERMRKLEGFLSGKSGWTIIGSSLGGLMGALYTCSPRHRGKVRKLILLAPALIWLDFAQDPPEPVDVPTVIYHGRRDDLLPLEQLKPLAEQVFTNLTFFTVDDDHSLHKTAQEINWSELLL